MPESQEVAPPVPKYDPVKAKRLLDAIMETPLTKAEVDRITANVIARIKA